MAIKKARLNRRSTISTEASIWLNLYAFIAYNNDTRQAQTGRETNGSGTTPPSKSDTCCFERTELWQTDYHSLVFGEKMQCEKRQEYFALRRHLFIAPLSIQSDIWRLQGPFLYA